MRDLQRQMSRVSPSVRQFFGEGFRFALVGIAATLVYVVASLTASSLGLTPYGANVAGFLSSLAVSYLGHSGFTFRSSQPHHVQGPKFLLVTGFTFALTNAIIFVVIELLDQAFVVASLAVALSIPPLTWLLSRLWVFRALRSGA